jgi:tetratricopeptide (TPR) repeat protein
VFNGDVALEIATPSQGDSGDNKNINEVLSSHLVLSREYNRLAYQIPKRATIRKMPLEPPDKQFFEVACGYAELGMCLDANAELEKIDPFNRAAPEVLALRISIYCGLEKWDLMAEIAKRLAEFQPDNPQWPVSLAYATRRAISIEAAKEILLNAEPKFPKEGVIKYNLACYSCQTGDIDAAKNYSKKAFEIDSSWRLTALNDEDLKPMWDSL